MYINYYVYGFVKLMVLRNGKESLKRNLLSKIIKLNLNCLKKTVLKNSHYTKSILLSVFCIVISNKKYLQIIIKNKLMKIYIY